MLTWWQWTRSLEQPKRRKRSESGDLKTLVEEMRKIKANPNVIYVSIMIITLIASSCDGNRVYEDFVDFEEAFVALHVVPTPVVASATLL